MRILISLLLYTLFTIHGFTQTFYPQVVLETTAGKIILELYDDTPFHSENFIKLINQGYYNNQLFHRVIKNNIIQAGDPNSKTAKAAERLGFGGPKYTIPAEFFPQYYHKKGALAAARQGDDINPKKESNGSQFYIVEGNILTDKQLDIFVSKRIHIPFTQEQKQIYTTIGGLPHLDYQYTVFGEVVSGLEIVDKICTTPTDSYNRPLTDVRIIKAYTVKSQKND